jgi:hypothetical protein
MFGCKNVDPHKLSDFFGVREKKLGKSPRDYHGKIRGSKKGTRAGLPDFS